MSSKKPVRSRSVEVCILAGGLSRRMGRDKARMRLGRLSLLGHVRALAGKAGFPMRVIREDDVPRCGPLGGVITALRSSRMEAVIFLSCDMPFVPVAALRTLGRELRQGVSACFYADNREGLGFPFFIRVRDLDVVEEQLARQEFSLQALGRAASAMRVTIPLPSAWRWMNVNTPAEFALARERLAAPGRVRVSRKARLVPEKKTARVRT